MFGLAWAHKRRAHARANEADAVGAGPDFLGDPRGHAGGCKRREHAVVKPGIVRAGEKDERGRREVDQAEFAATGEGMVGREQHAVFLLQQDVRAQAGRGRVGVEKTAGEIAGLQRGELGRGGRFVELEPDAGVAAVKFADDRRQDRGHGQAGKGNAHMADLAVGEGF